MMIIRGNIAVFFLIGVLVVLNLINCKTEKGQKASRVVLIGIDGVSLSGFEKAQTPNLNKLIKNGAISLKTRAVMPSVSGPNWGSHLLGAGPEQHGITHNGWTSTNRILIPTIQDEVGYFPSIFQIIREQIPHAKIGSFYDWSALGDMYNKNHLDKDAYLDDYKKVFNTAVPWIIENKADFAFIYVGLPDSKGHEFQWGSSEYIKAIENVDEQIGFLINEFVKLNIYDETNFIVVTDHGGLAKAHGGLSMEEMEIPWIISGPGIIKNTVLQQTNDVVNTAATIAHLFQLNVPNEWTGRAMEEALLSANKSENRAYVNQAYSNIKSGIYHKAQKVELQNNDSSSIFYTTDGKLPNENSLRYAEPILVDKSVNLKAVSINNRTPSRVLNINLEIAFAVESAMLKNMPSEEYSGKGVTSLFNKTTGSTNYKDNEWLGFHEADMVLEVDLGDERTINSVKLNYLRNEYSYIFVPQAIEVFQSVDGIEYNLVQSLDKNIIDKHSASGLNRIEIPFEQIQSRYLKVVAKNIGHCPVGHRAVGEKAWLFVDEIMVQ